MFRRFAAACLAVVFCLSASVAVAAWPEKGIRLIVPFNPGAGTDQVGRLVEKEFQEVFGQPLNFIYKPGADGSIGATELANARPDGYTIGLYAFPLMIMNPLIGKGRYSMDSFDVLAVSNTDVATVVVAEGSPIKTFADFVEVARANPNKMRVGVVEILGPSHITALKLQQAGVPMNVVPHAGGAKAMVAVLGGHIDALITVKGASLNTAGKIRYLAVASEQRDAELSAVPTLTEAGYPVVAEAARLWLAPKGLPADIREKLHQGLKSIYARPDVIERHKGAGIPVHFVDPRELKQRIDAFTPEAQPLVDSYLKQQQQ